MKRGAPEPLRAEDVAREFRSSDDWIILVGRSAADNDDLTFGVAEQDDFWLHVAATSGTHVVVRNPDKLARMPKKTLREAAALAVAHSKNKGGGRVAVHYTQRRNVQKARGAPAGQVQLKRYETVSVKASEAPAAADS